MRYTIEIDSDWVEWYKNDQYHHLTGPAIEYNDGSRIWRKDDKKHREDGPAIEYVEGDIYWYIDGKRYTEKEFNKLIKSEKK